MPSIFIQFEYATTVRPADTASILDLRQLAVGFQEIRAFCRDTGELLGQFNLRGAIPAGLQPIFGLSFVESWGIWSDGPRTALMLDLSRAAPAGLRLEIEHHIPSDWLAEVPVEILCGWTSRERCAFTGGTIVTETTPDADLAGLIGEHPDREPGQRAVPDLSIVIVNHNRHDLSFACSVAVLRDPPARPFEIVLVDNGSGPDLFAALEALALPVRLIRLAERRGIGDANGIGVEAALGATVVLLGADVIVGPGALTALHTALHASPDIGITGPSFLSPSDVAQEMSGVIDIDLTTTPESTPGRTTVDYVPASCLMVRRDDFLSLGGFDPLLDRSPYVEMDFCLRAGGAGLRSELIGQAIVRRVQDARPVTDASQRELERRSNRDRETMSSRWSAWLANRAPDRLPPPRRFDVSQVKALERPAAASECCFFTAEKIEVTTESYALASAIAAISRATRTTLALNGAHGVLRCCSIFERHGLTFEAWRMRSGQPDRADLLVHHTTELPPQPLPGGRRRILFYDGTRDSPDRHDDRADPEFRQRVRDLLGYHSIVVDCEATRQDCLRRLRRLGAPFRPVRVIRSPANILSSDDSGAKEEVVVAIDPFHTNASGGGLSLILDAFRRRRNRGDDRLRLILIGDLGRHDEVEALEAARAASVDLAVDFIVNPSRAQLADAFRRAKVCVSVDGFGSRPSDVGRFRASAGARIASAVATGCVPVVYDSGPASEVCEILGVGLRFHGGDELNEALGLAIAEAGPNGLPITIRGRAQVFSFEAYVRSWTAVLSTDADSSDGTIGSELASFTIDTARSAVAVSDQLALVVVGMHRSGTSAMARALSLAGATLPSDLMPSATDNPSGFWESVAVTELNNRLLRGLDSGWDDVFGFRPRPDLARSEPDAVRRAGAILRASYRDESLIILKDPRISLLIQLWETALLGAFYMPVYVVMVRDPRHVAASLLRRNGFPRSKGLLLWATYMVAVERDTRGARRRFVTFDDLLFAPEAALAKVEGAMDGRALRATPATSLELERFLDSSRPRPHDERPFGSFERLRPFHEAMVRDPVDEAALADAADAVAVWLAELDGVLGPTLTDLRAQIPS